MPTRRLSLVCAAAWLFAALPAVHGQEAPTAQGPPADSPSSADPTAESAPPASDAPPTKTEGAPPASAADAPQEESVEIPVRLLERQPFDRITLDAANDNAVIEVSLLELLDRRVPNPLPTSGTLTIYRISSPSIPYNLDWSAIAKIELFEQMLLKEAANLTVAGDFAEAFEYFSFLAIHYPDLPGLKGALEEHLWREASAAFSDGRREEAWPILLALYRRNPEFPRLANAVQAVSDGLIGARLNEKNYAAAASLLDALEQNFPKLQLPNIAKWRERFRADATAQLDKARAALAAKRYSEARFAVNYARSILPGVEGGEELWTQIQTVAPEIRIGVTQAGRRAPPSETPDWAAARILDLVEPPLVRMTDFGAEGGVYQSRWAEVLGSDAGDETTVRFSAEALRRGLSPAALARSLADAAAHGQAEGREDLARVLRSVAIADGRDAVVRWRRSLIRPEVFLQTSVRQLAPPANKAGLWFDEQSPAADADERELTFRRTGGPEASPGEPTSIVEMVFANEEEAMSALVRGDVDALDRVPPWQLAAARRTEGVAVTAYRLPTVHFLIPNPKNPLLEMREFRRALCYAIDGETLVRDILLGGEPQPGFRTINGPFPAGVALNDPVGYAYNSQLTPRPYEPRLALLLATVARTTLIKQEAAKEKEREESRKKAEAEKAASKEGANADASAAAEKPVDEKPKEAAPPSEEPKLPPMQPLVLAHPADPVARLACQSIKGQLEPIGIPIKLVEISALEPVDVSYDLLYAELVVREPLFDARRLLGPQGVAGHTTAIMNIALDQLDRARNWNQARDQLREIHRIAFYDLPMLPLWQTVNHFAYRKSIAGVGENPVSLYQNLPQWRKSAQPTK